MRRRWGAGGVQAAERVRASAADGGARLCARQRGTESGGAGGGQGVDGTGQAYVHRSILCGNDLCVDEDRKSAFAWLNKAFEARSTFMVSLTSEPKWEPLRPDPRFERLVRRMLDSAEE